MAGCPLSDAELEFLVEKVAERLQEGVTKEEIVSDIVDSGWDEAGVTAFVEEVARARRNWDILPTAAPSSGTAPASRSAPACSSPWPAPSPKGSLSLWGTLCWY